MESNFHKKLFFESNSLIFVVKSVKSLFLCLEILIFLCWWLTFVLKIEKLTIVYSMIFAICVFVRLEIVCICYVGV